MNKLLEYLFADKKQVYIEDIAVCSATGTFEVSWCREYTMQTGSPRWMDSTITRASLLNFIRLERLNYWESYRYCHQTGSVQPFENAVHDVDTFLDENYREVIAEMLEQGVESG